MTSPERLFKLSTPAQTKQVFFFLFKSPQWNVFPQTPALHNCVLLFHEYPHVDGAFVYVTGGVAAHPQLQQMSHVWFYSGHHPVNASPLR